VNSTLKRKPDARRTLERGFDYLLDVEEVSGVDGSADLPLARLLFDPCAHLCHILRRVCEIVHGTLLILKKMFELAAVSKP
jgi:hypothetical protein